MSVQEAAERLKVTPRRVRVMLQDGGLEGTLVGRSWAVDPGSVRAAERRAHRPGRPLSHEMARGFLDLMGQAMGSESGPEWDSLDHRSRSRLRAHLRSLRNHHQPAMVLRSMLRNRARRRNVDLSGPLDDLVQDPRTSLGGVAHPRLRISGGRANIHVSDEDAEGVFMDHLLLPSSSGAVSVHVENVVRVDLAACLVDIAQEGGPREDEVVRERISTWWS